MENRDPIRTVGELREFLDNFGDNVEVYVETEFYEGRYFEVGVDDRTIDGSVGVVLVPERQVY